MAGNKKTDEPLNDEPNQDACTQGKQKPESYTDQAKLVQRLIDGACITDANGEVTRNDKSKISNADLIRLLQFQREIAKERPVDIVEMRWIDPPKS
jgi:hypothetical protein